MLRGIRAKVSHGIAGANEGRNEVLFLCSGFESRSTAIASALRDDYRAERAIIFKYDERGLVNRREFHYGQIRERLEGKVGGVVTLLSNRLDPLDGIDKLNRLSKTTGESLAGKDVSVDFTVLTKQYLLILLKWIESQSPRSVRLFYAEPSDYGTKQGALTRGSIGIVSIPSYGGRPRGDRPHLLVLLLGYEGGRAFGVWERVSPDETVLVIGKPSYRPEWEGRVEKENSRLLKILPKSERAFAPTLDPAGAAEVLSELLKRYSEHFDISISPLGPKPQTVGCYLSLRSFPEVQVLYAIPKTYSEAYFSRGTGGIWTFS